MSADVAATRGRPSAHSGLYQKFFAWMLATSMGRYQKSVAPYKRRLFADIHGDVLEIGPGTGTNLAFFPKDIRCTGVEPNPYMHRYLQREAASLGMRIEIRRGVSEQLEAGDESIDTVISTLVLCSVPDIPATLEEVLRVLRPGGRFLFMEHVAAIRGTRLRRIQQWVRPVWKVIGDGCRPDLEIWTDLEQSGFDRIHYEHFRVPFPIIGPHVMGVATKGGGEDALLANECQSSHPAHSVKLHEASL